MFVSGCWAGIKIEAVVWRCSVEKVWPITLLKKRLWHRCFPVNFAKFLRTCSLQKTSGGCFCKDNTLPSPADVGITCVRKKNLDRKKLFKAI